MAADARRAAEIERLRANERNDADVIKRRGEEIARLREIVAGAHVIRCQCGPLAEPSCRELQDMALRAEPDDDGFQFGGSQPPGKGDPTKP